MAYVGLAGMTLSIVIAFLERAAIVILAGYVLFRVPLLRPFAEDRAPSRLASATLGVLFGLFSIYGTVSGFPVLGGVINLRDMGPLIAGLVGGMAPGTIAGSMGGIHRLLMGIADWEAYGLTAIPCAASTVLIGIAAGLIRQKWGLLRPGHAGLTGGVLEAGHIALAVLLAGRPTEMLRLSTIQTAWIEVGRPAALPMILVNALGVAMFFGVFSLYRRELTGFRERDQYYSQVEQRNLELRSVFHISQSMNESSTDLESTMRTIAKHVQEMLRSDGVRLYVPATNGEGLEMAATYGPLCSTRVTPAFGDREPASWIGEKRQGLLLEDATADTTQPKGDEDIGSLVGAPLLHGEEFLGVVEVIAKEPGTFNSHSQRLLETIAPQAAVAVHNARQVEARERALRETIEKLQIQIDEGEKQRQVEEITETDYFQSLRQQADRLRGHPS